MRNCWLHWSCTLAVIAAIMTGCASRNGSSSGGAASAVAKREAEEFKAQARQGLVDFLREKPRPPACEIGYLTGRQLTVLATSDWIERAGLRRGDRITSIDGVPASQLQNQARPPTRVPPGTPFNVGVSRGGRELSLTLICAVKPEVSLLDGLKKRPPRVTGTRVKPRPSTTSSPSASWNPSRWNSTGGADFTAP
jgi:hypothetical protein